MKKIVIVSSLLGTLLLSLNITIPLIFQINDVTVIIVTILSGWISGIATLLVGIIAAYQTKKYKQENDILIEKQYKLEKSRSLIHSRLLFVDNLKKVRDTFIEKANPAQFAAKLMSVDWNIKTSESKSAFFGVIAEGMLMFKTHYRHFDYILKMDYNDSKTKENAAEALDKYQQEFLFAFDDKALNKYMREPKKAFDVCVGILSEKFAITVDAINEYVFSCDRDINEVISNKNENNEYIVLRYAPKK